MGEGTGGFIVHALDRVRGGRTEIYLIGRLENGETFAVVESRHIPSFHVRTEDLPAARRAAEGISGVRFSPSDRRTMDLASCARISHPDFRALKRTRELLESAGLRTYEADLRPFASYLMDARIHCAVSIDGPWSPGRRVARVYRDPRIAPADLRVGLSALSLDIETDRDASTVYAVSLAFRGAAGGEAVSETFLAGASAPCAAGFPTEAEMLSAVRVRIAALDPDILTGWNVVDFDLQTLHRRFRELGLAFDIGRTDSPAEFLSREPGSGGKRGRRGKAIVEGRQVLDAMWLARSAGMGLEDYRLETVSREVLGRGKLMEKRDGESGAQAVERLYRSDPEALCAYCREDARLVLDILSAKGLLDLAVNKALLIGIQLEQTMTSVAGFEFLYMEHLHARGLVAPTLGIDQEEQETAPGGGIITSKPGLSPNVLAFDFKSLYPSIMRTFNIDPLARVPEGDPAEDDDALIKAPNGSRFRREPGILPQILARFFQSRTEAKAAGNETASYAYKIVMNSFYGVLGTPGCRFAAPQLAGAITTFGREILFWMRDLFEKEGHPVLYGDTDSLFVLSGLPGRPSAAELSALGRGLCDAANGRLAVHVRERWGVESRMELEFEGCFRGFFMPPMRTAGEEGMARGRAKGYAGLQVLQGPQGDSEKLLVVGMEAVRHDWSPLARGLQRDLLGWVFHGMAAAEIGGRIRDIVRAVRRGERDGDLVYARHLRGRAYADGRSAPPHVRAAALLPEEERTGLIRYVQTLEGPRPAGMPGAPPDREHYVQKQVRPIVETVAPFLGLDTRSLFAEGGQLSLFS